jgi:hypothetical protein
MPTVNHPPPTTADGSSAGSATAEKSPEYAGHAAFLPGLTALAGAADETARRLLRRLDDNEPAPTGT